MILKSLLFVMCLVTAGYAVSGTVPVVIVTSTAAVAAANAAVAASAAANVAAANNLRIAQQNQRVMELQEENLRKQQEVALEAQRRQQARVVANDQQKRPASKADREARERLLEARNAISDAPVVKAAK